jgi:TRAP-type C4-dicarboxylate transport system permease small subunit
MEEKDLFLLKITRWYRHFCTFFGVIAGLTILVMMLSTTIDTTLRYLFSRPIPGVFELNEVLLVVCVFLGLAWTQIERGHIRVVLILRKLPPKWIVVVDLLVWVICFVLITFFGIQSAKEALHSFHIHEFRWGSVQMPIWWAKALVPIGFWMMSLQLIIDIWTDIYRLFGHLPLQISDITSEDVGMA